MIYLFIYLQLLTFLMEMRLIKEFKGNVHQWILHRYQDRKYDTKFSVALLHDVTFTFCIKLFATVM